MLSPVRSFTCGLRPGWLAAISGLASAPPSQPEPRTNAGRAACGSGLQAGPPVEAPGPAVQPRLTKAGSRPAGARPGPTRGRGLTPRRNAQPPGAVTPIPKSYLPIFASSLGRSALWSGRHMGTSRIYEIRADDKTVWVAERELAGPLLDLVMVALVAGVDSAGAALGPVAGPGKCEGNQPAALQAAQAGDVPGPTPH